MGRAEARRAQGGGRGARRTSNGARAGGGGGGKKSLIRRLFTWKKILGTFFGLILLGTAALVIAYFSVEKPNPNEQATLQSNVYKFADGSILARRGEVNREIVGLDRVPKDVQTGFIAIENKSFYKDQGVDIFGVARGGVNTLLGRGTAGGSTITQQYVKNYFLNQEQTATRKLKELVISLKVDNEMEKDDILAGYLNTSYFGRGAYGIQAAAQAYYGVDVDKLTLEQGAYLAAVLQAPSQYDWATAGPNGKKLVMIRFNGVLDNMVEMGALDSAKRKTLQFREPIKPKPAPGLDGQKGYLVQAANAELRRQGVTDDQIEAGGWTITLNIEPKKQKALEDAVQDELESKLDRKDTKDRPVDQNVQAGATSVDIKTGHIVAMYGGTGLQDKYASNALRTDFQPGSTFKPVVLASAIENGAETQDGKEITPNTIYDGTSRRKVVGATAPFAPQNQDDVSYGDVTVQEATNRSMNSVYAQMFVDAEPPKVKKTGIALGMKDRPGWDENAPALSLGTMSANTVEMAGVYATFGHHGKRITPTIIKSATHAERTFNPQQAVGGQAISSRTADTVTKVLVGVVEDGSGKAVRSSAYQAAAKTGTTESNVAAWFAAYTPELATVVAMFGEEPGTGKQTTLTGTAGGGRAGGSSFPAAIWKAYTLEALQGADTGKFDLEDADMGAPAKLPSRSASPSSSASTSPSTSASTSPSTKPSGSHSPNPSGSQSSKPNPSGSSSGKPSSSPPTKPTPPTKPPTGSADIKPPGQ
ncbi:transglycosylase domain-containing protein [Streptomyces sp. NPDC089799]|uniref:transglycosylase domain-containing protein n=1 Tax=Streptomyces sp. NPDC089799 TaxID=3155066 RepID=UPI00342C11C2